MRVNFSRHIVCVLVIFAIVMMQQFAMAAARNSLQGIRWSNINGVLRLVFDFAAKPDYQYKISDDGKTLNLQVNSAFYNNSLPKINSNLLSEIKVENQADGSISLVIRANGGTASFKVMTLQQPDRLVVDISASNSGLADKSDVTGKSDSGSSVKMLRRQISEGLSMQSGAFAGAAGPVWVYLLEINGDKGWRIKPALSNGEILGREVVSDMAEDAAAVAAVNASYFMKNGEIIGLLKINGEVASTDYIVRSAVGILPNGNLIFGQPEFVGAVEFNGEKIAIDAINRERGENGLVLFNHFYGARTGSNEYGIEYVFDKNGVIVSISKQGNSIIPDSGGVLSAHGKAAVALTGLKSGDKVNIRTNFNDAKWDSAQDIVGAGPTLVRNGKRFVSSVAEEFLPDIAKGRAPRTAIGSKADGTIVLFVVDGRRDTSVGMTLDELADYLIAQGVTNAVNLDGGGSSELWLQGSVINKPSDGKERLVGDAILVYKQGG